MNTTNKPTFLSLIIFICIAAMIFISCNRPEAASSTEQVASQDTIVFDSALAKKVGADDYGMKPYVLAFLKAGPNRDRDSLEAAQLQQAHMDNITRMVDAGKLVIAGPFIDDGELRGIYIFNVASVDEARELTSTDPAIQAGSLVMELHPWYSSAALPLLPELHKQVAKKNF